MSDDGRYSRRGVLRALGAVPLLGLTGVGSASGARRGTVESTPTPTVSDSVPPTAWTETYGEEGTERLSDVVETADGGYLAVGQTKGPDTADSRDGWVVKMAGDGAEQWVKILGGEERDDLAAVIETSDGGYLAAGKTQAPEWGDSEGWFVKMAADGTEEWTETYEGPEQDGDEPASFAAVTDTSDGGYLAAGYAITDPVAGKDRWDGWLLKTAADGSKQLSELYGKRKHQNDLFAVTETSDGGYLAAGRSISVETDTSSGWLLKTATDGTREWVETWGGTDNDELFALIETSDDGYLAAGKTHSFGAGISDGWLVKVGGEDPDDGPSVADYANDDDIVDTDGLREAITDWRAGDIDTALLRAVIEAWRSGDPVPVP